MYNPRRQVFDTLQKFNRPLTHKQLHTALPNLPVGTISSALNTFVKERVVESVKTETSGRGFSYRLVVQAFPAKWEEGRLNAPVQRGLTRRSQNSKEKPEAVLLMIPLPKNQSAVVTMDEAKRIYEALAPLFKGV